MSNTWRLAFGAAALLADSSQSARVRGRALGSGGLLCVEAAAIESAA
jgi:hypothetical protein